MDRPLSYDSLRTVLQYMEPNLRFIVSRRIPSISCAERAAPLKIDKLSIESYGFVVNEHIYRLGIYRDYPLGTEVPIPHKKHNSEGGVQNDLDQYGIDNYSSNEVATPRDLVIGGIEERVVDENGELIERQFRVLEQVLARRLKQGDRQLNWGDPNLIMNVEVFELLPLETLKEYVHMSHTSLKPYLCRRSNTSPEFTKKIQFTVSYPNGEKQILRRSGDMMLCEAQKNLANGFFGKRRSPIHVKHLSIECQHYCKILRLPQNFRLKVRQIEIKRHDFKICDALQPVIDDSSFPLELFHTMRYTREQLTHPMIKSAQKLSISRSFPGGPWMTEFQALENREVYLSENEFDEDDYVVLVRAWIDNRRAIGTCYTVGLWDEEDVISVFLRIKEACNGEDSGERTIRIAMSDSAEIRVFYVSTPNQREGSPQWMLSIEIVAV